MPNTPGRWRPVLFTRRRRPVISKNWMHSSLTAIEAIVLLIVTCNRIILGNCAYARNNNLLLTDAAAVTGVVAVAVAAAAAVATAAAVAIEQSSFRACLAHLSSICARLRVPSAPALRIIGYRVFSRSIFFPSPPLPNGKIATTLNGTSRIRYFFFDDLTRIWKLTAVTRTALPRGYTRAGIGRPHTLDVSRRRPFSRLCLTSCPNTVIIRNNTRDRRICRSRRRNRDGHGNQMRYRRRGSQWVKADRYRCPPSLFFPSVFPLDNFF